MFLGICLTFQSPPILLLMEKMTYNCYYIGIRMMHIAFLFPPIFIVRYSLDLSATSRMRCLLKTRNFQQRKYLDISCTLSNDIKIMLSLSFYISKENVH